MKKPLAAVVLVAALTGTAFAGRDGAPRVLPTAGVLGRLTGISIHWQRVPIGDGQKGLRADVYRREGGVFVLRQTAVTGTHASGVSFTNSRRYFPVEDRRGYAGGDDLREEGRRRIPYASGTATRKRGDLGSAFGDAADSFTRNTSLLLALLTHRVDKMSQTTRFPDGRERIRTRYGLKDATVETREDGSGVVLPFKVVK